MDKVDAVAKLDRFTGLILIVVHSNHDVANVLPLHAHQLLADFSGRLVLARR